MLDNSVYNKCSEGAVEFLAAKRNLEAEAVKKDTARLKINRYMMWLLIPAVILITILATLTYVKVFLLAPLVEQQSKQIEQLKQEHGISPNQDVDVFITMPEGCGVAPTITTSGGGSVHLDNGGGDNPADGGRFIHTDGNGEEAPLTITQEEIVKDLTKHQRDVPSQEEVIKELTKQQQELPTKPQPESFNPEKDENGNCIFYRDDKKVYMECDDESPRALDVDIDKEFDDESI